ncbi:transporter [Ideonella azotifigens]|uniref:Transporter n=1 Tax=Ideonella azotifigens TaxID=513160 RepID=A0ABN1JMI2_9BURK|nr:transporter [Ideonella azotifigens]MCD2339833.1 transporter [Ideonella azotifigens]
MAAALPLFRFPQLAMLTLLAACALPSAFAGDEIVTDRPDFVESSDVVGRGRFQIETGFSSERQDGSGLKTRTRSTPTLLRLGVSDALELRIETDGAMHSRTQDTTADTTTTHGFADTSLGLKWRMQEGDEETGAPGMAWLLHADLASGSRDFRGQGVRPSLRFVAEWDLPHDFSVGVMPGLVADKTEDGKRFAAGIFAVTLGKGWGPAWHSFVEIAGQQLAAKHNGGKVVSLDFGASYLVTDSLQLDLAASRGLTRETADFQWGAGVSIRF